MLTDGRAGRHQRVELLRQRAAAQALDEDVGRERMPQLRSREQQRRVLISHLEGTLDHGAPGDVRRQRPAPQG